VSRNTLVPVSSSKLIGMHDISPFRLSVSRPADLSIRVIIAESAGRSSCVSVGRSIDDADDVVAQAIGVGFASFSGRDESREEKLGEEEVADYVCSELQLIALSGLAASRRLHDASIIE